MTEQPCGRLGCHMVGSGEWYDLQDSQLSFLSDRSICRHVLEFRCFLGEPGSGELSWSPETLFL